MRFYATKEGIICVGETHSSFFEKNFDFEKNWKIVIPTIPTPKERRKAYSQITSGEFLNHLNHVIESYKQQASNLEVMKKDIGEYLNKVQP